MSFLPPFISSHFETTLETEFSHRSEVVKEKFSLEPQLGSALAGSQSLLPGFSTEDRSHRRGQPVRRNRPASLLCSSLGPPRPVAVTPGLGSDTALGSEGTHTLLTQQYTGALFPYFLCFLTDLHSKTWKFSSEWVFISGSKPLYHLSFHRKLKCGSRGCSLCCWWFG